MASPTVQKNIKLRSRPAECDALAMDTELDFSFNCGTPKKLRLSPSQLLSKAWNSVDDNCLGLLPDIAEPMSVSSDMLDESFFKGFDDSMMIKSPASGRMLREDDMLNKGLPLSPDSKALWQMINDDCKSHKLPSTVKRALDLFTGDDIKEESEDGVEVELTRDDAPVKNTELDPQFIMNGQTSALMPPCSTATPHDLLQPKVDPRPRPTGRLTKKVDSKWAKIKAEPKTTAEPKKAAHTKVIAHTKTTTHTKATAHTKTTAHAKRTARTKTTAHTKTMAQPKTSAHDLTPYIIQPELPPPPPLQKQVRGGSEGEVEKCRDPQYVSNVPITSSYHPDPGATAADLCTPGQLVYSEVAGGGGGLVYATPQPPMCTLPPLCSQPPPVCSHPDYIGDAASTSDPDSPDQPCLDQTDSQPGRIAHNAKERARRARISDACERLRVNIPGLGSKADKATVLEVGILYIKFLKRHARPGVEKQFLKEVDSYNNIPLYELSRHQTAAADTYEAEPGGTVASE